MKLTSEQISEQVAERFQTLYEKKLRFREAHTEAMKIAKDLRLNVLLDCYDCFNAYNSEGFIEVSWFQPFKDTDSFYYEV